MTQTLTFEWEGHKHTVKPKKPTRMRLRESYLMLVDGEGEDYDPCERFVEAIDDKPPEQSSEVIQALAAAEVRSFYDFLESKVAASKDKYG